jgi:hypothetical protein
MVLVKINGEQWEVHFTTRKQMPAKTWGDCCGVKKQIRVRRDLSQQNVIDTLVHELRHAIEPFLDEAFVDSSSTVLAEALIKCGIEIRLDDGE